MALRNPAYDKGFVTGQDDYWQADDAGYIPERQSVRINANEMARGYSTATHGDMVWATIRHFADGYMFGWDASNPERHVYHASLTRHTAASGPPTRGATMTMDQAATTCQEIAAAAEARGVEYLRETFEVESDGLHYVYREWPGTGCRYWVSRGDMRLLGEYLAAGVEDVYSVWCAASDGTELPDA